MGGRSMKPPRARMEVAKEWGKDSGEDKGWAANTSGEGGEGTERKGVGAWPAGESLLAVFDAGRAIG